MTKILVPTDFSDNAMKAVEYAAEIAKKSGATVYLLHVIESITVNTPRHYPLHEKLQKENLIKKLGELNALQQLISQLYPDIKTEKSLFNGTIITSILDFAEKNQVDLIVMGTKGATGLKEFFTGSIAAGTISLTSIPVLAVPDEYVFEVPDAVLFATNHFEKNQELLNKIFELAKLFSTTIHVVVFIDTDTAEAIDYIYNTRQLNHYMEFLKKSYPAVSFKGELLEGIEFDETIEKYDIKNEVDIVAMITYPKSFWEKIIKKSTTNKMAFHSRIPVLAIPAK